MNGIFNPISSSSSSSSSSERDPKFYSELKQTNEDLCKYIEVNQKKSPYFDYTETFKSYTKIITDLQKQYPPGHFVESQSQRQQQQPQLQAPQLQLPQQQQQQQSNQKQNSQPQHNNQLQFNQIQSKQVQFNQPQNSQSQSNQFYNYQPQNNQLQFGQLQNNQQQQQQNSQPQHNQTLFNQLPSNQLQFNLQQNNQQQQQQQHNQQREQQQNSNKPLFSVDRPANNSGFPGFSILNDANKTLESSRLEEAADDAEAEDAPPPEPNLDKYEEQNVKFQCRCKLYERIVSKKDGPIPPAYLGCGELFVKEMDSPNKLHLIMRQDPDFRKVLLNQIITPTIPLKLFPKTLQFLASTTEDETKFYVTKVRDDKISSELFAILNSVKS